MARPATPSETPVSAAGVSAVRLITPASCANRQGWLEVRNLLYTEAEDLLDWLENHGICVRELSLDDNERFAVRWQHLPGN
jgi:hypothetical protein